MFSAAHVKAIFGDLADRPSAANNFFKALRSLLRHAVDIGLIVDNPSRDVRKFASRTEGFHSSNESYVATFETRHEPGTRAHLA